MPFTLVGFYKAEAGAATLDLLNVITDPHVRAIGTDVWIPGALPFLCGYQVNGANLTAARIESPTLRTLTPIDVEPLDANAEPSTPSLFVDQHLAPKSIGGGEALNIKATVSGAGNIYGLAWLSDGPLAQAPGEIFTIKATGTATLVAANWTNVTLTMAQTLPKGTYQVVGLRAYCAGAIAARLVFPGYSWRPGAIAQDAVGDLAHESFRHGRLGVWGSFEHDVPPTADFLSISADTAETVFLDLIKSA
jgi:hypothetical protein